MTNTCPLILPTPTSSYPIYTSSTSLLLLYLQFFCLSLLLKRRSVNQPIGRVVCLSGRYHHIHIIVKQEPATSPSQPETSTQQQKETFSAQPKPHSSKPRTLVLEQLLFNSLSSLACLLSSSPSFSTADLTACCHPIVDSIFALLPARSKHHFKIASKKGRCIVKAKKSSFAAKASQTDRTNHTFACLNTTLTNPTNPLE